MGAKSSSNASRFTIAYCDENNIHSEWFKFDNRLVDYLLGLMSDSDIYSSSEWAISTDDAKALAYTMCAILQYQKDGCINERLEQFLNIRSERLSKVAFEHAKTLIDDSRIALAERIYNGSKGGRPPINQ